MKKYIQFLKGKTAMSVMAFILSTGVSLAGGDRDFPLDKDQMLLLFVVSVLVFVILTMVFLINFFRIFLKYSGASHMFAGLMSSLNDAVPLESEEEIMTDHVYDGIRELDNNLPPWWKYLFYASIVFAGVYLYIYHFSDMGYSQAEEYNQEMLAAEKQKELNLKLATFSIDESNVPMADEAGIVEGAEMFASYCAACHGGAGEGGVGPNLTDEYWLHGGSLTDVYKTIKEGVPSKGMISWKSQLSPGNMQQIASYIMTLKGTNPANAKEPQGELYKETKEPQNADSESEEIAVAQ